MGRGKGEREGRERERMGRERSLLTNNRYSREFGEHTYVFDEPTPQAPGLKAAKNKESSTNYPTYSE